LLTVVLARQARRENVLAVGKLLLRCRLLGGAKRFGAHGEERGGDMPWRPPAYSLLCPRPVRAKALSDGFV